MAVNKVVYGNTTIIDLTADTVEAGKMMNGVTAHDASGATITGTASVSVSGEVLIMPEGFIQVVQ